MVEFYFKGVLKKSDGWVGLGCCELAIAVECRQACKQVRLSNFLPSLICMLLNNIACKKRN